MTISSSIAAESARWWQRMRTHEALSKEGELKGTMYGGSDAEIQF